MGDKLPAHSHNQRWWHPYLERYYLFSLLGWTFYLHQFVGSDPDRGLHDHPWARAYSIILSGWYWEQTRSGMREVHWFNTLCGDNFHRVILPKRGIVQIELEQGHRRKHLLASREDAPCWTFFFHTSAKIKPWGFWRPNPTPTDLVAASFDSYRYSREGDQDKWWLTAPKGRELRKAKFTKPVRFAVHLLQVIKN